MSRIVGYGLLVVAALMAVLVFVRLSVVIDMSAAGIPRKGAAMELLFLALCGVALPLGISALLLKKSK